MIIVILEGKFIFDWHRMLSVGSLILKDGKLYEVKENKIREDGVVEIIVKVK